MKFINLLRSFKKHPSFLSFLWKLHQIIKPNTNLNEQHIKKRNMHTWEIFHYLNDHYANPLQIVKSPKIELCLKWYTLLIMCRFVVIKNTWIFFQITWWFNFDIHEPPIHWSSQDINSLAPFAHSINCHMKILSYLLVGLCPLKTCKNWFITLQ
jgi:hypothetical protein